MFGGDVAMLTEMQGSVRMVASLAQRKLGYLDRVPYLLSRLGQKGVAKRVLEQYAEGDPNKHHRLTHHFLRDGSELRAQIQDMAENDDTFTGHPLLRCVGA
jgi:hypothetical protein